MEMFDVFTKARTQRRALRPRRNSRGFGLLIALALGMASTLTLGSTGQTPSLPGARSAEGREVRVRKSVTALTTAERKDFVDAVVALKRAQSPYDASLSYYDQFVQWHKERYVCHPGEHEMSANPMLMIHTGPMFLPWHRELIQRFERALRDVSGKDITLPYWDWSDPESVNPDNPRGVFREDFMGGDGNPDEQYAVTTGPFRKGAWALNVHPEGATWASSATAYLTRHLGRVQALPTRAQVEMAMTAEDYDVSPYSAVSDPAKSFRSALEGTGSAASGMECGSDGWMALVSDLPRTTPAVPPAARPAAPSGRSGLHNLIHSWVGGSLSPAGVRPAVRGTMLLTTSPNDPTFFLHHANIDRLWAEWQAAHPGKVYAPKNGYSGNNADSAMAPFGDVSPQQVEDVSALGYRYASP
jgi:tyrosinase